MGSGLRMQYTCDLCGGLTLSFSRPTEGGGGGGHRTRVFLAVEYPMACSCATFNHEIPAGVGTRAWKHGCDDTIRIIRFVSESLLFVYVIAFVCACFLLVLGI